MARDVIADLEARISTNVEEFKRQMSQSAEAVKSNTGRINNDLKSTDSAFGKVTSGIGSFLKSAGMIAGTVINASSVSFKPLRATATWARSVVPVAPYSRDMP